MRTVNEKELKEKALIETVTQLFIERPEDFVNGRRLSKDGTVWENVNFETGEVSNHEPV
jgi:hypothetical protein